MQFISQHSQINIADIMQDAMAADVKRCAERLLCRVEYQKFETTYL